MKNFIDTIKNIWSIQDLKSRIITTLSLLLIYRIGSFVVLPGVNSAALVSSASGGGGGIADLLSMFTGGAFSRASIFALGIMPYISASIIIQLLGMAVPAVQKMQKEGESGRKRLNQYTRLLTILICVFQAPSYIYTSIDAAARPDGSLWLFTAVAILTAGTLFVMWLGEKITDKGLGNGTSLIIMIGIIANLPAALLQEFLSVQDGGGLVVFLIEIASLVLVVAATIMLIQGTRKVQVQFAKKVAGAATSARGAYSGARQYIPIKVNSSGVMPIIFAQAIMFVPLYIGQAAQSQNALLIELSNFGGFWYNALFATMIVVFTYFYTAIMVNPNQMAEDMKRNGGFIPGFKPGKETADYLDSLLSRLTFPGALFLAAIAILPAVAMIVGVKQQFAVFYGGTSLLIMVGVVLDTLQQIESHLLSRHYDGLMKSGKIVGRQGDASFGMAS